LSRDSYITRSTFVSVLAVAAAEVAAEVATLFGRLALWPLVPWMGSLSLTTCSEAPEEPEEPEVPEEPDVDVATIRCHFCI
jgi:hypothetical protein